MEQFKTIAVNIAIIAAISLALFAANTQYRQWSQFSKGEQAEKSGDYNAAMAGYESAIHMYTPFSPLVTSAAERLWRMAEGAEQRGQSERALITYRALRSSFYSATWLLQPGEEWIRRCDERIASLVPRVKKVKG
jgi:tetratricopeptide (TPR) repeat protein